MPTEWGAPAEKKTQAFALLCPVQSPTMSTEEHPSLKMELELQKICSEQLTVPNWSIDLLSGSVLGQMCSIQYARYKWNVRWSNTRLNESACFFRFARIVSFSWGSSEWAGFNQQILHNNATSV
jgi:hypothetical protein